MAAAEPSPELAAKIAAAKALLAQAILHEFPRGRVALVSSFGADSAVLLHMVAGIDPGTAVVFVDTGKLFPETLAYREQLAAELGLGNIIVARPKAKRLATVDPDGTLWSRDADLCCWERKVEPLDDVIINYPCQITGRKRFQAATRATVPEREEDEFGLVKLNPLADWSEEDVRAYFALHALPDHPLYAQGYRSIGCAPCTRAVKPGEDSRAGRWAGKAKIECGIHLPRETKRAA